MSKRTDRVASVIKRALARPVGEIAREFTTGLVTVTSVRMSPDLQVAKVYLSVYGGALPPATVVGRIEKRVGELKSVISREVRIKFMPELRIYIDDTLDRIDHIQSLLDSVPPSTEADIEEDGDSDKENNENKEDMETD